jgi:hypothetical protein
VSITISLAGDRPGDAPCASCQDGEPQPCVVSVSTSNASGSVTICLCRRHRDGLLGALHCFYEQDKSDGLYRKSRKAKGSAHA